MTAPEPGTPSSPPSAPPPSSAPASASAPAIAVEPSPPPPSTLGQTTVAPVASASTLPPVAAAAASSAVRAALRSSPPSTPTRSSSTSSSLEEGEIKGEPAGPQDPQALVTVFSDPHSFNAKHPLYSTWTLWFDNASRADKAKSWDDQLQQVMQVESVEEFWGLYHNIVPPSLIQCSSNYYLFKQGIRPAWEDPSNHSGGRWMVQVPKDKSKDSIDLWWLYTMLDAIGETFETPYTPNGELPENMTFTDEVTGVIVSSRRMFYRISIWTRTSDTRSVAENIGRHFKYGVLGMGEGKKYGDGKGGLQSDCEFQSHADSQKKKKACWTV